MSVRPFDWRDFLALYRHRKKSVFLNSALFLTRGPMLVSGTLISYFMPSFGIFTCVNDGVDADGKGIIGQFMHASDSQNAKLSFLTPDELLRAHSISVLIEYMITLSGERGALRLLADVDEQSSVLEALRRLSFSIYSRQNIWRFPEKKLEEQAFRGWRTARREDVIAIRSLYNNLIPGLVNQVEPFLEQRPKGLVYFQQGELLAYVSLRYGRCGIWANPLMHPDMEDIPEILLDLLEGMPGRSNRPLYFCVRSYQSWLEIFLEDLGATVSASQAVMFKHLALPQKVLRPLALPSLERGQPEVSAPIAQVESK